MESNQFCEHLVRVYRPKWRKWLPKALQIAGVAYILLGLVYLLFIPVGIIFLIAAHFLKKKVSEEYDYQYLDGVLQIDLITNLKDRKTCGHYDLEKLSIMAPEGHERLEPFVKGSNVKVVDYTSRSPEAPGCYVAVFRAKETLCLLLEPTEEMVQAMWRTVPSKVIRKRKEY